MKPSTTALRPDDLAYLRRNATNHPLHSFQVPAAEMERILNYIAALEADLAEAESPRLDNGFR